MKNITAKELYTILQDENDSRILIDVRTPAEHMEAAITGAKNFPLEHLEGSVDDLKEFDTVYVHCASGRRSQYACEILAKNGIENPVNVTGGIAAWQQEHLAVEQNTERISVMRQVMIAAGALVLISVSGFLFLGSGALLLAAAVGAGLLFAGVSGHCFMAQVLSKLPYNK